MNKLLSKNHPRKRTTMTLNSDLKRHENLTANSKSLGQLYNSSNNRDGDMLGPHCLHGAQQLNQRRICICPAYLRGYKFPPYTLSLRWQNWAPAANRDGHRRTGWWAKWHYQPYEYGHCVFYWRSIWVWTVWMSLAIGQNPKLNQTKPQAAFERKKKSLSKYDSAEFFAGIVLLNPSGVWQLAT